MILADRIIGVEKMIIDHIGYAVKKIDKAKRTFEKLGFQFEEPLEDTDRNIFVSFGKKDGYCIELVSPLNKNEKSPVDGIIQKMGSTPYHVCFRSHDLDKEIEKLNNKGFKVIIPPANAAAFGGRKIVFMMGIDVGLIEIIEETRLE